MTWEGYSEKVMEHFAHPRNIGVIENPDGVGQVGNPICGDIMKVFIEVKDGRIVDAKFQTFGCAAAIATSSMGPRWSKEKPSRRRWPSPTKQWRRRLAGSLR